MKELPVLELYHRIMCAKDESEMYDLQLEVQASVMSKVFTDEKDMMILNLALQVKSNYFLMKELLMSGGIGSTMIVVGNMDDFDPEEEQLKEFKEREFDDFKEGNVVLMKDFTKKK